LRRATKCSLFSIKFFPVNVSIGDARPHVRLDGHTYTDAPAVRAIRVGRVEYTRLIIETERNLISRDFTEGITGISTGFFQYISINQVVIPGNFQGRRRQTVKIHVKL
jgi:hypothetical protein